MRYMLLITFDPRAYEGMSENEQQSVFQEYFTVSQTMDRLGVRESGEALQPINTATTVRVRDGKRLVMDGPFAETKEHVVGYYILNCKNLDEALDFAAKIPDARYGSIEVRPIREIEYPPAV
jgi:hypothetical protein